MLPEIVMIIYGIRQLSGHGLTLGSYEEICTEYKYLELMFVTVQIIGMFLRYLFINLFETIIYTVIFPSYQLKLGNYVPSL